MEFWARNCLAFFPNLTKNLMLTCYSKNQQEVETHILSTSQIAHNWCKMKHVLTCFYYDRVPWLPSSSAIKSFQEVSSYTLYLGKYCWSIIWPELICIWK